MLMSVRDVNNMNTTILSKCIAELKSECPDLSYIKGMLETLIEMGQVPVYPPISIPAPIYPYQSPMPLVTPVYSELNTTPDEGSGLVKQYENGPIANIA